MVTEDLSGGLVSGGEEGDIEGDEVRCDTPREEGGDWDGGSPVSCILDWLYRPRCTVFSRPLMIPILLHDLLLHDRQPMSTWYIVSDSWH